jgi:hypothetical protein
VNNVLCFEGLIQRGKYETQHVRNIDWASLPPATRDNKEGKREK